MLNAYLLTDLDQIREIALRNEPMTAPPDQAAPADYANSARDFTFELPIWRGSLRIHRHPDALGDAVAGVGDDGFTGFQAVGDLGAQAGSAAGFHGA